jgi:CRP-like cAMP-binding protein
MALRLLLQPDEIELLCAAGRGRRLRRAEVLFSEGDRSEFVFIIRRGAVKVLSASATGYETVLGVRSSGEIIGELAALDGKPRCASVVAVEPTDGFVVDGKAFRTFLVGHPTVMLALLGQAIGRLREADRRRLEFGTHNVAGRVARVLLDLADQFGAVIPLAQHEIAGATGASREMVARALRGLRDGGVIATERGRIVILDRESLVRVSTA